MRNQLKKQNIYAVRPLFKCPKCNIDYSILDRVDEHPEKVCAYCADNIKIEDRD